MPYCRANAMSVHAIATLCAAAGMEKVMRLLHACDRVAKQPARRLSLTVCDIIVLQTAKGYVEVKLIFH
jgi:hypothetical protein